MVVYSNLTVKTDCESLGGCRCVYECQPPGSWVQIGSWTYQGDVGSGLKYGVVPDYPCSEFCTPPPGPCTDQFGTQYDLFC